MSNWFFAFALTLMILFPVMLLTLSSWAQVAPRHVLQVLVCLCIIVVLFFLSIPLLFTKTSGLHRGFGHNNFRQIALALCIYESEHNHLPPCFLRTKDNKPGLSWRVAILPYIEQGALYEQFKLDEPWDSPHNIRLLKHMPGTFSLSYQQPSPIGSTHIRILIGEETLWHPEEPRALSEKDIPDGSGNTILLFEAEQATPWTKPDEPQYGNDEPLPRLGASDPDTFLVGIADGNARHIPRSISEKAFRLAIGRSNGIPLDREW